MSFSAHADAKGIMQLIQYCEPKHVILVHGEAEKMEFLAKKIRQVTNSMDRRYIPKHGKAFKLIITPKISHKRPPVFVLGQRSMI